MLTPKEKIRLLELQEKEKEPHVPFTTAQLEEFAARSVEYSNATLGHLNGFTDFLGAIAQWSKGVAYDNTRLLQEIYYLKEELEKAKSSQINVTMQTVFAPEGEAAEQSVEPTVPNVGDSARKRGRKSKASKPA